MLSGWFFRRFLGFLEKKVRLIPEGNLEPLIRIKRD